MMKRFIQHGLVIALITVVAAGCSSDGAKKDPYALVSLRQAAYGPPVISKGFRYKIRNPKIVEAVGHLVLVREGEDTEIIAGRSLAEKIERLDKNNIEFRVVKKYSPFTHFKCEEVISGPDTVFISQAGAIYYPSIYDAATFQSKRHPETEMSRFKYNDTAGLERMKEKRYSVKTQLAKVEEDGEEVWMLVGDRANLRIASPDDATEIVFRLLSEEGLEFDGGFTFNEVEDWGNRKNNHVAGTVQIDYVKYMGKVFRS